VDPLAETLATLSHPLRLEILFALVRADGPLEYSSLRASTPVEDKGQFNYHLRQLRGRFVADRDGGYVPTPAGRSAVRTVLTDAHLHDD
jgi:DNA-binding transcriptional ArsR family regulator